MRRVAAGAFALVLLAAPVGARQGGWRGEITPQVSALGIGGDLRPGAGGPELEIDASFSDLLEHLDAAFLLSGLARRNRLVLFADASSAATSAKGVVPPGIPAEVEITQTSPTGVAGYSAVDGPAATLARLAGARACWVDAEVAVPALGLRATCDTSFVDPIVAARVNVRLAPRRAALGCADVGGSGVGSEITFRAARSTTRSPTGSSSRAAAATSASTTTAPASAAASADRSSG